MSYDISVDERLEIGIENIAEEGNVKRVVCAYVDSYLAFNVYFAECGRTTLLE